MCFLCLYIFFCFLVALVSCCWIIIINLYGPQSLFPRRVLFLFSPLIRSVVQCGRGMLTPPVYVLWSFSRNFFSFSLLIALTLLISYIYKYIYNIFVCSFIAVCAIQLNCLIKWNMDMIASYCAPCGVLDKAEKTFPWLSRKISRKWDNLSVE